MGFYEKENTSHVVSLRINFGNNCLSATEDSKAEEAVEQVEEVEESSAVSESEEESAEEVAESEEAIEEPEEESLLSVVGVYYGDLYANQKGTCYSDQSLDGFSDCIIVFDYANDATNRTLPDSSLEPGVIWSSGFTCPEVTLSVNDANTYEAYDPNGYDGHYSNAINRYTSYSNPIGYGNLLGGADPVRMYSVFYVNPNELKADTKAVLTVADQSVTFDFANIEQITYPDEILRCEDNYEELQQLAAFKWRMDKIVVLSGDVDGYMASMNPGSDLGGVGSSISSLFSSDYGVTISGQLSAGFGPDHTFDGMTADLPHFNIDTLTNMLPDQQGDISAIVDATNRLGSAVQDSSYSKNDVEDILKEIIGYYANLTSGFDMEAYKK